MHSDNISDPLTLAIINGETQIMFAESTLPVQDQANGSGLIRITPTAVLVYQIIAMVLLSLAALAENHFFYRYPGNLYLPPHAIYVTGINLVLMYSGFFLLQGREGQLTQIIKHVIYFFLIIIVIGWGCTAAQYTPFPTIDQHILTFESLLNIDSGAIIAWTYEKPWFKTGLESIYASINYQLLFLPLLVIIAGRIDLIRQHYFLLITTALIGFTFYYFFPTTAPASIINSHYFTDEQRATYLKFFQIHHYIQPTTSEGGLIAFPSFHVIWAWLCLYLVREWSLAFMLLLPINVLLVASCVLLGWHYCSDILGSVVVIILAHYLYRLSSVRH